MLNSRHMTDVAHVFLDSIEFVLSYIIIKIFGQYTSLTMILFVQYIILKSRCDDSRGGLILTDQSEYNVVHH